MSIKDKAARDCKTLAIEFAHFEKISEGSMARLARDCSCALLVATEEDGLYKANALRAYAGIMSIFSEVLGYTISDGVKGIIEGASL